MNSSVLTKIMPARAAARDASVVVDLDDLIAKPVAFKFRGKTYLVEPVTAEKFIEISDSLAIAGNLLTAAQGGAEIHDSQVYAAYQKFVSALVPSFTVDILKQMQLAQVHALINLIIKHATGQPMNLDETIEKKKIALALKT